MLRDQRQKSMKIQDNILLKYDISVDSSWEISSVVSGTDSVISWVDSVVSDSCIFSGPSGEGSLSDDPEADS